MDKTKQIKTYEIFTTTHSEVHQAENVIKAIEMSGNPDNLIGVQIADTLLPVPDAVEIENVLKKYQQVYKDNMGVQRSFIGDNSFESIIKDLQSL